MQQDGVWHALIKDKTDMGGHGFNASLRDWGRFGQFVLTGGTRHLRHRMPTLNRSKPATVNRPTGREEFSARASRLTLPRNW